MNKNFYSGTNYDAMRAHDALEWVRPLWDGGGWVLHEDGRLRNPYLTLSIDIPWICNRHMPGNRCGYWSAILFDLVGKRFAQHVPGARPFVPSPCHDCFKVVVRPRTLAGLFALDAIQKKSGLASKCGIEIRPWTGLDVLYGGYHYNRSLEEGRNCYKIVRRLIDGVLGPDTPVILKRGCTEMEMLAGPSDRWVVTEEQLNAEYLVGQIIDLELNEIQPLAHRRHVKRLWVEWAYVNGDETWQKFAGGPPRPPLRMEKKKAWDGPPFRPVTYHE